MKKFTVFIFLFGLLFINPMLKAQPGCGDADQGALTLTEEWQTLNGDAGIIPYWSFDALADATYGFSSCLCSEDTYLRIYDDTYSQVAYNDDNGPHCSTTRASINWTCNTSGTYYVSVAKYSCNPFANAWTLEYKQTLPIECNPIAAPLFEDFEGDFLPECWSKIVSAGNDITKSSSQNHTTDGSYSARFSSYSSSSDYNQYLFSPQVIIDDVNTQLSFWHRKSNSSSELLEWGIATTDDPGDYSWTPVVLSNTQWNETTVDLTPYIGQTVYLGFHYYGNYAYYVYLDDVSIQEPPACLPPSDLTADEITTTTALLGWTENGEATSWNIEFGEVGFTPTEMPTNPGVDNPFMVDGLTAATSYDFYVQTDCGSEVLSEWVGPYTFTTLCEVSASPFSENFDGDYLPLCWSEATGDVPSPVLGSSAWGQSTNFANASGNSPGVKMNLYLTDNDWLISPEIDLGAGDKQVTFKVAATNWNGTNPVTMSAEDKVYVLIGTSDNWDLANAITIYTDVNSPSNTGDNETFALTGWSGVVRFAFYAKGSGTVPDMDIHFDDFVVEDLPPPGMLAGSVSALDSGDPLEGVSVVAEPGTFEVFTNALGEYDLELMPGEYEVTFSHPDYYTVGGISVVITSEQTTTLNAVMETVPAPVCADLISPADNSNNAYPDAVLEWESPEGSPNVHGYKISLYNLALGEWIEENTDLGNVTTYTPAQPFDWGTSYIWLLTPYNNSGEAEGCAPWTFTTSFAGMIDGYVEDSQTGMPVEDVDVSVVEVFPNSGYTHDLMTDVDGNWELEWETGVYNITFSKFGYFDKTVNTVSINNGQITQLNTMLDPVTPYPMPFVEDWSSGSFATQQWTKEGNWILSSSGFPGPSADFHWNPRVVDFDMDLQSYFIDARDQSEVYVQFAMFLDDYPDQFGVVTLTFMVFDGEQWIDIDSFDNQSGDIIGYFTYDVSEYVAGKQFLLGFKAAGADAWDIDGIYIDNILVTNSIFEVDPPSVSDVLFFNETNTYDIDLFNFGFGDLDWEAEITPASPWATLNELSGVVEPGSGTVELTFDAALAGPGTHTAEITFTAWGGLFEKTVMLELKVYEEAGQQIMIPEPNSWGYISTYVGMDTKAPLDELFADVLEDMVILIGEDGIFWPGYSINTLIDYDTYKGYKMKMGGDGALAFLGNMVENKTASFNAGIAMIPVLSEEPVSAEEIFGGHNIEFAFGLDGSIYWPAGPVMTLTTLYPGFGYLVKFNEPTTLDFDVPTPPKGIVPNKPVAFANTSHWNDVYKTSGFHMIGITAEAATELQENDIIGVFNSDGLCTGMINYTGNNQALAIPVFVDDMTSMEIDGMAEYEPMQIKIFREGEEIVVNPVYKTDLPNHDGLFATNGYSVISSFKEGATGIVDQSFSVRVYPNPSEGIYNIDGFDGSFQVIVTNSQGQLILKKEINDAYQLDLTANPNGIYFIRLTSDQSVKLVKVIKQ